MSDKLYCMPIEKLFKWVLEEEKEGRFFGLHKELLFTPNPADTFRMERYGKVLETPIGVASGPHSQLSHNIIAAWLCGARYLELKTVQTLDEIEVTKPCIDMEDEGYNCEWSQELKVHESFDEYLNAWIIIHILKHKFGWDMDEPGFIFNMSVGYDLAGLLKPNIQWYFDKMNDCSEELEEKIKLLEPMYPAIREINIPSQISNNITLSTMHGCPSDEIEKIGKYLIEERNLHTAIKLNPTLLGPEVLRNILNDTLGYEITVPDEAFGHDLKYEDAVSMIKSLQQSAKGAGVEFGLKLTNTLESLNSTKWLPQKEKMVYTSGRALHPISINVARKLQNEFNGELDLTFSAGVDAFNVSDTLSCNLTPITVCSDLLKPGGYLRMMQYLDEIDKNIKELNSLTIEDFIKAKSKTESSIEEAALNNLKKYADEVCANIAYHKETFPYENIKTTRELTPYDCIHSPCIKTCDVDQNVPEYMYHTANEDFESAYRTILKDNPLPNITGNVCDHLCQSKCTRINYDNPLLIRGIKRFISEQFDGKAELAVKESNGLKAAIIGAGPSGLTCAYFLALEGFDVTVYESKEFAGGMISDSIPTFRLTDKQIEDDIKLLESIGVKLIFNSKVTPEKFETLQKENDYIYIGIGAQAGKKLQMAGEDLPNVFDQLSFLSKVRREIAVDLGKDVAIIGGGLSAVDAVRAAKRIVGSDGSVKMVYRRTKKEMPVGDDEIKAFLEEGIELLELTAPLEISKADSKLSLKCVEMKLGEKDSSGRQRPVPIEGSEFDIVFDSIITAIGQDIVLDFIEDGNLNVNPETNETQFENIFAGGDAIRGADSLINAMGDGKRTAERIIKKSGANNLTDENNELKKLSAAEFQKVQAFRDYGIELPETGLEERAGFDLVHPVLTEEQAVKEAKRCMFCEDVCNICVGVCPNFSNVTFDSEKIELPVWQANKTEDGFKFTSIDKFIVQQGSQIFNIGDFCNECGNCDIFCPTGGAPYKTKPHFYITEKSFEAEGKGYFIDENGLRFKSDDKIEKLSVAENIVEYKAEDVEAKFSLPEFELIEIISNSEKAEFNFAHAAEMYFLFKNLKDFPLFK